MPVGGVLGEANRVSPGANGVSPDIFGVSPDIFGVSPEANGVSRVNVLRSALIEVARGELGVRERTGRNDGARVAEYLAYCGLGEGYEWCAAFVSWSFGRVGLPEPRTPWSPALFPAGRVLWSGEVVAGSGAGESPRPGDVFGIWVREKGRIGHAGLVEVWDGGWCISIEGNSGNAVRRVRRPVSTIYRVADWITDGVEGGTL